MMQTLLTHIPSTLLHLIAGALLMDTFFKGRKYPFLKRLSIMAYGGLLVITLDIPKLFGFIFTHSLFFLPVLSFGLALLTKRFIVSTLMKNWAFIILILLIGGIAIDFFGNGAHLWYPLSEKNVSFSIIQREWVLLVILILIFMFRLIPFNR
ncbi:hypothetical protein ATL39_3088 [Sinobaca qinghaiensis]|uniref:Uncharacterized protein n=1 Tax=Sinobaca qinghaiensis TaxID=342944 RepID=A0A419UWY8_9BACL|nr:hypothetical protein [Sinobaca qinghaiensis]RKD69662.1 hypothetical protein ATL39_3088 [Sinobaca qinghaiensis]